MRRVPAAEASLQLEHVKDCCCYRITVNDGRDDVKMIDARCIAAYLVPEEEP
jgi:hypothetical protein